MVFNRGPGVISISEFFDPVKVHLILVAPWGYLGNVYPRSNGSNDGPSAGQPVVVLGIAGLFHPGHDEGKGITDRKKEKREYQICRSAAMPGGMLQWGINIAPAAWIIHKDHQSYRRSAKNIEGIETLFQQQEIYGGS